MNVKTSKQVRLLTAITAVVVVIAIVLALLLSSLPSSVLEFDMTANDLYSITDQTDRLLKGLTQDIDIVVVAEGDALDEHLVKFLEKYTALSSHLSLSYADPVLQPSVVDTYGVENNTVLVSCPDTGRSATFAVSGFDGQNSAALLYDYNRYYTYGTLTLSSFDAEGQLTSAITNVISENQNKIYYMAGHGESQLSTTITDLIHKGNYAEEYLDLLNTSRIPEDCQLIICNNPTSDISEDELSAIKRYLTNGGNMILICDNPDLENFGKLLQTYGMQMEQGYIADLANFYESYMSKFGYYCFWPIMSETSPITKEIAANAMVISARALTLTTPDRRGSTTEVFLKTSPNAVNYVSEENMTEGQFPIGVVATEIFDEDTTSRLTVFSSAAFVEDAMLKALPSISNKDILLNAINANFSDVTVFSIPARSMSYQTNTFTNTTLWGMFFAVMVPVIFIAAGLIFWTQRRKK